jgi:hypothetical protein
MAGLYSAIASPSLGSYLAGASSLLATLAAVGCGGYWLRRWLAPSYGGALARLAELVLALALLILTLEAIGSFAELLVAWLVPACIIVGLAPATGRLRVHLLHQRDRVQPYGCDAADPAREDDDAGGVGDLSDDRAAGGCTGREHPPLTGTPLRTAPPERQLGPARRNGVASSPYLVLIKQR